MASTYGREIGTCSHVIEKGPNPPEKAEGPEVFEIRSRVTGARLDPVDHQLKRLVEPLAIGDIRVVDRDRIITNLNHMVRSMR